MIVLDKVNKWYGDFQVLTNCTTNVSKGEVVVVCGPSGSGKSTLIRCVNLLERPTTGTVSVDGQELTGLSGEALNQARHRIGMIFQHFNLLDSRTAAPNVTLPLELAGVGRAERTRRAAELLGLVGAQPFSSEGVR